MLNANAKCRERAGRGLGLLSMSGIPDRGWAAVSSVSNSVCNSVMGSEVPSARSCSCPRLMCRSEVKPRSFLDDNDSSDDDDDDGGDGDAANTDDE